MVRDQSGSWHAVEVDTYNPRPLGTTALVDAIAKYGLHEPAFCLVTHLATILGSEDEWTIVVSEKERYYSTSYETLAVLLGKVGVRVRVLSEDMVAGNLALLRCRDGPLRVLGIPESMDRNPTVRDYLLDGYRAGSVQTMYPPKAYLGSKAFLPFIATHPGVNGMIPPTALLTGKIEDCVFSKARTRDRIILKSAHSSGSKAIVLQDDERAFTRTIADNANPRTPLWVAQQQVQQGSVPIVVFAGNRRVVKAHYLRMTLYATAQGIAGIKMTGRPSEIVHGAPDCIHIPVIRPPKWQEYLSSAS